MKTITMLAKYQNSLARVVVILLILFSCLPIDSQATPSAIVGHLSYTRYLDDNLYQYVLRSGDTVQTFEYTDDECVAVSPDSKSLAVYYKATNSLGIVRLESGEPGISFVWSRDWKPCNFTWIDSMTLRFGTLTNHLQDLNTLSGVVESVPGSSTIWSYSELPFRIPMDPNVLSNQGDRVIYNQCFKIIDDLCAGESQVVIYDIPSASVVEVLSEAESLILGARKNELSVFPPNPPSLFWSPSDRYVLYTFANRLTQFKLYAVRQDIYLSFSLPSETYFVASQTTVKWSHDEAYVGFWVFDLNVTTNFPSKLLIYDISTKQMRIFNMRSNFLNAPSNWVWSPDSRAIALVNSSQELVLLDTTSGTLSVLDTGVISIRSWVAN
jgi:hypothetical protein